MTSLCSDCALPCNTEINYTPIVVEGIRFPFILELDLMQSNLTPAPDENQRFCYIVKGVGEDLPIFSDISHFVLGICPDITKDQIKNVKVWIDDMPQEVQFYEGGNVELKTPLKPDPPTRCAGLKFDFEVIKVLKASKSVLRFCFELDTVYPLGNNEVCLAGKSITARGLSICGPACKDTPTYTSTAYVKAAVCVPVFVLPYATAGTPTVSCCGLPLIVENTNTCNVTNDPICRFTLTQNICITVPIVFGATATTDAVSIECLGASDADDPASSEYQETSDTCCTDTAYSVYQETSDTCCTDTASSVSLDICIEDCNIDCTETAANEDSEIASFEATKTKPEKAKKLKLSSFFM